MAKQKLKRSGKFYKVVRVGETVIQFQECVVGDGSIGTTERIYYTLRENLLVTFHLMSITVNGYSAHINNKRVDYYYGMNYQKDEVAKPPGRVNCFSIQFEKPAKDSYITLADIQLDLLPGAWLSLEYHYDEPVVVSYQL
jgi:hypothetical protein